MFNDLYLGVLVSAAITLWCVADSIFRLRRFYMKNGHIPHPRVSAIFVGIQALVLCAGVYSLLNPTRAALALALVAIVAITPFPYGFLRRMLEPEAKRKRKAIATDEKPKRRLEIDSERLVTDDGEIMEVVDDEKRKYGGDAAVE
jgi:hypothetical protein